MQLQSLYPCLWRYMGYAQIAEHTTGIIKEPAKYGNKVSGNLMGLLHSVSKSIHHICIGSVNRALCTFYSGCSALHPS